MELLTNYPIKSEWIQWALQEWKKFYGTCRTSEQFLEKAKLEVQQIGEKFLHMGKKHLGNQKWPKLPEDLLVLLWILRFGIHDDYSLSTTALFFSPDCIKTPSDSVDYIYFLYWLKTHIFHPAMQVYNLFENDCDTLKIFDDYYMGGDSIQKCNKESILTRAAEIFKKLLLILV